MKPDKRRISVVVPFYNEEENIDCFYESLASSVKDMRELFDFIFVDDGSIDNSFFLLQRLSEKDARVRVIKLSRNFGHQAAISCGLDHCGDADAVVVMDGDGQDPPELIPGFVEKWKEGFAVVYGLRRNRKESIVKKIAYNLFYKLLSKVSSITVPPDAGDFALTDRCVLDVMLSLPERERYLRGLRAWVGFKQVGLEYDRPARIKGETKYSLSALIHLAVEAFFSVSSFPVYVVFYLALTLLFFSLGLTLVLGVARMMGLYDVPGWTSLFTAILFFGSIQLFGMAVIAEYCGKIFREVKARPIYVVEKKVNLQKG